MKINIWVHKDDIESGNITKWYNCREKVGGDWSDYYQIAIDKDEFFKLLDNSNNWEEINYDAVDEYFKDEEAMIFERNHDTGKVRSRKAGDYENTTDVDEKNKFLVEQYNRNRDIEDHISDINEIRNTA